MRNSTRIRRLSSPASCGRLPPGFTADPEEGQCWNAKRPHPDCKQAIAEKDEVMAEAERQLWEMKKHEESLPC
jgi:hypothetical protein